MPAEDAEALGGLFQSALRRSIVEHLRQSSISTPLRDADGGPSLDGDWVVGFIGFTGPGLRGGLTLCSPRTLLLATFPPELSVQPDELDWLEAWWRESCNMMLAAVRAALRADGVRIELSTPSSISGSALSWSARPGGITLGLQSEAGTVHAMLEFELSEGFRRCEAGTAREAVGGPGDALFFF